MARKSGISKMSAKKIGGERLDFAVLKFTAALGEKKNYNFQPEVTEYKLWPFSTIEWVPAEGKYKARAIVQHKTTHDMVVFNSWHQDYATRLAVETIPSLAPRTAARSQPMRCVRCLSL